MKTKNKKAKISKDVPALLTGEEYVVSKNNLNKFGDNLFKIATNNTQTLTTSPGVLQIRTKDGNWEELGDIIERVVIQTIKKQLRRGGLLSR